MASAMVNIMRAIGPQLRPGAGNPLPGYRSMMPVFAKINFPPSQSDFSPAVPPQVAKNKFLAWLRSQSPDMYTQASRYAFSKQWVSGLGDTTTDPAAGTPSTTDSLISAVTQILPAWYGAQAQKSCVAINLQRAQAGLTPIDCSSSAPQVAVGLSPQVQSIVWVGVLGALALGAFSLMRK